MDIYQENGFASREEYLLDLADSYGVEFEIIDALANLLGPEEDFDGLLTSLEDYCE